MEEQEIKQIVEGISASGFVGYLLPCLRGGGGGGQSSPSSYSIIVYKKNNEIRAKDWQGENITSGQAGIDDGDVIQAAINALPSEGGTVFLRDGTYNLTNTISINKNNVNLLGNWGASIITSDQNINLISVADCSYVRIASLWLHGSGSGDKNGVFANNADYLIIRDCIIEKNGAQAPGYDVKSCGIGLYTGCHHAQISENIIRSNGNTGIFLYQNNDYVIIKNNYISENSRWGIHIWSGNDYTIVSRNFISGQSYASMDTAAIAVRCASKGTIITENILFNNKNGVFVSYDTPSIMIINNIFWKHYSNYLLIYHPSAILHGNRIQREYTPEREIFLTELGSLVLSDHFNSNTLDSGKWETTTSGSASVSCDPEGTGRLVLSTGTTINSEAKVESYMRGRLDQYAFSPLVFKGVKLNSQSNVELKMGLYYDDDNYALIEIEDETHIKVVTKKSGSITSSKTHAVSLTSYHDFAFLLSEINKNNQYFYIDDASPKQIGYDKAPGSVPLRVYVRLENLEDADKRLEIDAIEYRMIPQKN